MVKEKLRVGRRGAETGLKGRRKAQVYFLFSESSYTSTYKHFSPCLIAPCSPCPTRAKISPIFLIYPLVMAWMSVSPQNSYSYPTVWWYLEMGLWERIRVG